jgi:hypothetical protein
MLSSFRVSLRHHSRRAPHLQSLAVLVSLRTGSNQRGFTTCVCIFLQLQRRSLTSPIHIRPATSAQNAGETSKDTNPGPQSILIVNKLRTQAVANAMKSLLECGVWFLPPRRRMTVRSFVLAGTFVRPTPLLRCSKRTSPRFLMAQKRGKVRHFWGSPFLIFLLISLNPVAFSSVAGVEKHPIDLVVTIGGDGTILHASSLFSAGEVPPVLSFSMGTLGFLLPFRSCPHPSHSFTGFARVLLTIGMG